MDDFASRVERARMAVRERLAATLTAEGRWPGELSSSALATAVAVFALAQVDRRKYREPIEAGLKWLSANVGEDGGWGDTVVSLSNLSTTLLCRAALSVSGPTMLKTAAGADAWLARSVGSLESQALVQAVLECYGNDRTFSAPILCMCAIAGQLPWQSVPQLPFELAMFPRRFFKWLRLDVVSYALPALIAIGLARHCRRPSKNPLYLLRQVAAIKTVPLIQTIQPPNGGFLEATPLTGFVVMALAVSGYPLHPVVSRGAEFLLSAMRSDGSWPIDSDLTGWVTALSVNALCESEDGLSPEKKSAVRNWILARQYRRRHPFTRAAPGGWAWTDLPGGVPDADDTAGAIVALKKLGAPDSTTRQAAADGIRWLLDLQNSDGGIPTFCRGWGKLPFDKSCPDITAHALRAMAIWRDEFKAHPPRRNFLERVDQGVKKGIRYLCRTQRRDGSWVPLWFGNQYAPDSQNPVYATAQVVLASSDLPGSRHFLPKAVNWLIAAQNQDGGWGGAPGTVSSIEETALATAALCEGAGHNESVRRGLIWLLTHTREGRHFPPSPIGLYFARLWYFEKMYPITFTALALEKATAWANTVV